MSYTYERLSVRCGAGVRVGAVSQAQAEAEEPWCGAARAAQLGAVPLCRK